MGIQMVEFQFDVQGLIPVLQILGLNSEISGVSTPGI